MRRQTLLGFAAGVGVSAVGGLLIAAEAGTASPPPMVNRYQIAGSDANRAWVVDSTSGHVWEVAGGPTWSNYGTPPGR